MLFLKYPGALLTLLDQMAIFPNNTACTVINTAILPDAKIETEQAFLAAWTPLAAAQKAAPGCISLQAYRGAPNEAGENNLFIFETTWESKEAATASFLSPNFQNILEMAAFPNGTQEYQTMVTKKHVPGICVATS